MTHGRMSRDGDDTRLFVSHLSLCFNRTQAGGHMFDHLVENRVIADMSHSLRCSATKSL